MLKIDEFKNKIKEVFNLKRQAVDLHNSQLSLLNKRFPIKGDFACSVYCLYLLTEESVLNYFVFDKSLGEDGILSNISSSCSELISFASTVSDEQEHSNVIRLLHNIHVIHLVDIDCEKNVITPHFLCSCTLSDLYDRCIYERLVRTKKDYYNNKE
ncbi:hypothetical protein [Dipodfec virus UOA04_Rod_1048]|nr:hypothetical protein [Dipodfec virus UOA04_Rod_1048]